MDNPASLLTFSISTSRTPHIVVMQKWRKHLMILISASVPFIRTLHGIALFEAWLPTVPHAPYTLYHGRERNSA
nr:hypothetical protein Q903MT_gene3202 [Picea sitchensis]